ncbi:MAG: hypothetical protein ACRDO4_12270 [Nocardioides sp.]
MTPPPSAPGFSRGPRVADSMTRDYLAFVESSVAAERHGDAASALQYHQGIPMFARSAHRVVLTQLVDLSEEMTPWLWVRWAAYQCTRSEDVDTACGLLQREALDQIIHRFHGEELDQIWYDGGDPVPLVAQTVGEDWAFHQLCTFEMGGLEAFLDELASGSLAEESELAWHWFGARMGGYRLEEVSPLRLRVRDLATDKIVDLLDLGAHVNDDADGFLVGRVVASGTEPGLMFDSRPLAVDEQIARDVAAAAGIHGGWLTVLESAILDGRFAAPLLRSEDRELATDVPGLLLMEAGTSPGALASAMTALRHGRDEIGRAAFRILRSVADGTLVDESLSSYVGAAVLNPHAWSEWQRQPAMAQLEWERWSALVPEPARSRLRRLATLARSAA